MDLQMIVPVAFDWDCDGDIDLIVGDEDGRVALIENTGLPRASSPASATARKIVLRADRTPRFLPPRYFQQEADTLKCGALATPFGCDWDGDGTPDLLLNSANADLYRGLGLRIENPPRDGCVAPVRSLTHRRSTREATTGR